MALLKAADVPKSFTKVTLTGVANCTKLKLSVLRKLDARVSVETRVLL